MSNMIVTNLPVQPATPEIDHLHKHMVKTYFVLRRGMACIAILFPLLLWWGGAAAGKENIMLNLAGAFAVGVALFPTGVSWLHGPCALLLFACMVYVSFFTHGDTVKYILDEKRAARFRRTYKFLAFAMFACPALAAVLIGQLAWDTGEWGGVRHRSPEDSARR